MTPEVCTNNKKTNMHEGKVNYSCKSTFSASAYQQSSVDRSNTHTLSGCKLGGIKKS